MNHAALLARYLTVKGLISDVAIVDIGCSGGIDPALRQLEPRLCGVGVDPLVPEIERLRQIEQNPKLTYVCAFAVSDRMYVDGARHSGNWFERSQAFAVMEPELDITNALIAEKS